MKYVTTVVAIALWSFSAHAKDFSCVGTEPFWGANINTEMGVVKLDYTVADGPSTVALKTKIVGAAGVPSDYAFAAKAKYTTLSVVSNPTCTDGMSEDTYSHSVMVIGATLQPLFGCCNAQ